MISHKIYFQKHVGVYFLKDANVMFYGVRFSGILEAVNFLKYLKPGGFYTPWCYGRTRGLKDLRNGKIYVDNRWMDCAKTAELYLKVCK